MSCLIAFFPFFPSPPRKSYVLYESRYIAGIKSSEEEENMLWGMCIVCLSINIKDLTAKVTVNAVTVKQSSEQSSITFKIF